jgi:hypothetical protein
MVESALAAFVPAVLKADFTAAGSTEEASADARNLKRSSKSQCALRHTGFFVFPVQINDTVPWIDNGGG